MLSNNNLVLILIGLFVLFLIFGKSERFNSIHQCPSIGNLPNNVVTNFAKPCIVCSNTIGTTIYASCKDNNDNFKPNLGLSLSSCPRDINGKYYIKNNNGKIECEDTLPAGIFPFNA